MTVVGAQVTGDADEDAPFQMRFSAPDTSAAGEIVTLLDTGRRRIASFFDQPFVEPVTVEICPDRAAFTATFPPEWGLEETQCWMVATGVADRLTILSPRVWREQACEHDPDDVQHVEGIVIHELVHVYHGQYNPTRDFTGAEELGWFIEGVAVYVSGQLDEGHVAPAQEALELGLAPESLETAWSGKYRYGVCGSLVHYLDATCGRRRLTEMLGSTSQQQLLEIAGLTELELLASWRDFVAGSE